MDREQEEMQFLGHFGMYKESIKIIITWWNIFTKITISLISPLTFIFLAHEEVSRILMRKIWYSEDEKDMAAFQHSPRFHHLSDVVKAEWALYWFLKTAYFTFFLIFSLLSTAAVVYTIASIYTGRDVSFKKVMTVVPKVWKRLMATFLCTFFAFLIYNLLASMLVMLLDYLFRDDDGVLIEDIIIAIMLLVYGVGFAYMAIIWQLACVVSVLETSYGVKAMLKSKDLIKGNMWGAMALFCELMLSFFFINLMFEINVEDGDAILKKVGYGILYFLLLLMVFLFGLVVQTVPYLVCKLKKVGYGILCLLLLLVVFLFVLVVQTVLYLVCKLKKVGYGILCFLLLLVVFLFVLVVQTVCKLKKVVYGILCFLLLVVVFLFVLVVQTVCKLKKVVYGILCFLLLLVVFLFVLVVQTVLYLVCKLKEVVYGILCFLLLVVVFLFVLVVQTVCKLKEVVYGILCFLLLLVVFLFVLVVQTVCKLKEVVYGILCFLLLLVVFLFVLVVHTVCKLKKVVYGILCFLLLYGGISIWTCGSDRPIPCL